MFIPKGLEIDLLEGLRSFSVRFRYLRSA